jgi:protein translocase SEC61 complex gamma subunit
VNALSNVGIFWENTKRIIKLSKKPTRKEIWMQFKISMLGLFAVGTVGFIIKLLFITITRIKFF